jgi:hypothetical protein
LSDENRVQDFSILASLILASTEEGQVIAERSHPWRVTNFIANKIVALEPFQISAFLEAYRSLEIITAQDENLFPEVFASTLFSASEADLQSFVSVLKPYADAMRPAAFKWARPPQLSQVIATAIQAQPNVDPDTFFSASSLSQSLSKALEEFKAGGSAVDLAVVESLTEDRRLMSGVSAQEMAQRLRSINEVISEPGSFSSAAYLRKLYLAGELKDLRTPQDQQSFDIPLAHRIYQTIKAHPGQATEAFEALKQRHRSIWGEAIVSAEAVAEENKARDLPPLSELWQELTGLPSLGIPSQVVSVNQAPQLDTSDALFLESSSVLQNPVQIITSETEAAAKARDPLLKHYNTDQLARLAYLLETVPGLPLFTGGTGWERVLQTGEPDANFKAYSIDQLEWMTEMVINFHVGLANLGLNEHVRFESWADFQERSPRILAKARELQELMPAFGFQEIFESGEGRPGQSSKNLIGLSRLPGALKAVSLGDFARRNASGNQAPKPLASDQGFWLEEALNHSTKRLSNYHRLLIRDLESRWSEHKGKFSNWSIPELQSLLFLSQRYGNDAILPEPFSVPGNEAQRLSSLVAALDDSNLASRALMVSLAQRLANEEGVLVNLYGPQWKKQLPLADAPDDRLMNVVQTAFSQFAQTAIDALNLHQNTAFQKYFALSAEGQASTPTFGLAQQDFDRLMNTLVNTRVIKASWVNEGPEGSERQKAERLMGEALTLVRSQFETETAESARIQREREIAQKAPVMTTLRSASTTAQVTTRENNQDFQRRFQNVTEKMTLPRMHALEQSRTMRALEDAARSSAALSRESLLNDTSLSLALFSDRPEEDQYFSRFLTEKLEQGDDASLAFLEMIGHDEREALIKRLRARSTELDTSFEDLADLFGQASFSLMDARRELEVSFAERGAFREMDIQTLYVEALIDPEFSKVLNPPITSKAVSAFDFANVTDDELRTILSKLPSSARDRLMQRRNEANPRQREVMRAQISQLRRLMAGFDSLYGSDQAPALLDQVLLLEASQNLRRNLVANSRRPGPSADLSERQTLEELHLKRRFQGILSTVKAPVPAKEDGNPLDFEQMASKLLSQSDFSNLEDVDLFMLKIAASFESAGFENLTSALLEQAQLRTQASTDVRQRFASWKKAQTLPLEPQTVFAAAPISLRNDAQFQLYFQALQSAWTTKRQERSKTLTQQAWAPMGAHHAMKIGELQVTAQVEEWLKKASLPGAEISLALGAAAWSEEIDPRQRDYELSLALVKSVLGEFNQKLTLDDERTLMELFESRAIDQEVWLKGMDLLLDVKQANVAFESEESLQRELKLYESRMSSALSMLPQGSVLYFALVELFKQPMSEASLISIRAMRNANKNLREAAKQEAKAESSQLAESRRVLRPIGAGSGQVSDQLFGAIEANDILDAAFSQEFTFSNQDPKALTRILFTKMLGEGDGALAAHLLSQVEDQSDNPLLALMAQAMNESSKELAYRMKGFEFLRAHQGIALSRDQIKGLIKVLGQKMESLSEEIRSLEAGAELPHQEAMIKLAQDKLDQWTTAINSADLNSPQLQEILTQAGLLETVTSLSQDRRQELLSLALETAEAAEIFMASVAMLQVNLSPAARIQGAEQKLASSLQEITQLAQENDIPMRELLGGYENHLAQEFALRSAYFDQMMMQMEFMRRKGFWNKSVYLAKMGTMGAGQFVVDAGRMITVDIVAGCYEMGRTIRGSALMAMGDGGEFIAQEAARLGDWSAAEENRNPSWYARTVSAYGPDRVKMGTAGMTSRMLFNCLGILPMTKVLKLGRVAGVSAQAQRSVSALARASHVKFIPVASRAHTVRGAGGVIVVDQARSMSLAEASRILRQRHPTFFRNMMIGGPRGVEARIYPRLGAGTNADQTGLVQSVAWYRAGEDLNTGARTATNAATQRGAQNFAQRSWEGARERARLVSRLPFSSEARATFLGSQRVKSTSRLAFDASVLTVPTVGLQLLFLPESLGEETGGISGGFMQQLGNTVFFLMAMRYMHAPPGAQWMAKRSPAFARQFNQANKVLGYAGVNYIVRQTGEGVVDSSIYRIDGIPFFGDQTFESYADYEKFSAARQKYLETASHLFIWSFMRFSPTLHIGTERYQNWTKDKTGLGWTGSLAGRVGGFTSWLYKHPNPPEADQEAFIRQVAQLASRTDPTLIKEIMEAALKPNSSGRSEIDRAFESFYGRRITPEIRKEISEKFQQNVELALERVSQSRMATLRELEVARAVTSTTEMQDSYPDLHRLIDSLPDASLARWHEVGENSKELALRSESGTESILSEMAQKGFFDQWMKPGTWQNEFWREVSRRVDAKDQGGRVDSEIFGINNVTSRFQSSQEVSAFLVRALSRPDAATDLTGARKPQNQSEWVEFVAQRLSNSAAEIEAGTLIPSLGSQNLSTAQLKALSQNWNVDGGKLVQEPSGQWFLESRSPAGARILRPIEAEQVVSASGRLKAIRLSEIQGSQEVNTLIPEWGLVFQSRRNALRSVEELISFEGKLVFVPKMQVGARKPGEPAIESITVERVGTDYVLSTKIEGQAELKVETSLSRNDLELRLKKVGVEVQDLSREVARDAMVRSPEGSSPFPRRTHLVDTRRVRHQSLSERPYLTETIWYEGKPEGAESTVVIRTMDYPDGSQSLNVLVDGKAVGKPWTYHPRTLAAQGIEISVDSVQGVIRLHSRIDSSFVETFAPGRLREVVDGGIAKPVSETGGVWRHAIEGIEAYRSENREDAVVTLAQGNLKQAWEQSRLFLRQARPETLGDLYLAQSFSQAGRSLLTQRTLDYLTSEIFPTEGEALAFWNLKTRAAQQEALEERYVWINREFNEGRMTQEQALAVGEQVKRVGELLDQPVAQPFVGVGARRPSRSMTDEQALVILGLSREQWNGSRTALKKVYYKRANEAHPDKFENRPIEEKAAASARFMKLNEAYEMLLKNSPRD